MTDTTLRRGALRRPASAQGRVGQARRPVPHRSAVVRERPLAVRGVLAAGGAVLAGVVLSELVVLILWAADAHSGTGASAAARSGLVLWSLAHHGDVVLNSAGAGLSGRIGIAPLGLLLVPLLFARRAGRQLATSEERIGHVVGIALSVALPYSAIALLLASLGTQHGFHAAVVGTAGGAFVLALLGASWGAGRAAFPTLWAERLPTGVRAAIVGALGSLAVLVGSGALVVGLSLALHAHMATDLARAVAPGVAGGVGLWLLSLAFVPNAALWGLALCVGPGFSVGIGTSVTLGSSVLGGVPALPLLAALPSSGPQPAALYALLAVPVLAGVLAGVLVGRALPGVGVKAVAGWAALAGPLAGVCAAILAALAGGALGPGRLATAGPSAWQVGMAVAEEVAVGAALTAALLRWRTLRH